MTKIIPLTQGKQALVDDEDYEFLMQWKWHFRHDYAMRNSSRKFGKQKKVRMHRVIMNTPEGMETDHKNGNTLDNRKSNLRICTAAQNRHNGPIPVTNTSGYKGVNFHKRIGKWQVNIKVNSKPIYIGMFDKIEDAVKAYDRAAIKYHGEFAATNKQLKARANG